MISRRKTPPKTSEQGSLLACHIRWMITRDMPAVMEIERGSFSEPWTDEDFIGLLRQRNCIGMVAEHGEQIAGFMIYELHKSKLFLVNIAVDPGCRRLGVGRQMIKKLADKLHQDRRSKLVCEVAERNLAAQLWLSRLGFKAVAVITAPYEDSDDDAFRFVLNLGEYRA